MASALAVRTRSRERAIVRSCAGPCTDLTRRPAIRSGRGLATWARQRNEEPLGQAKGVGGACELGKGKNA